jgi:Amidases related to nicotinamidase
MAITLLSLLKFGASHEVKNMQKTALLIVDVQRAMIDSNPFDEVNVIENIRKLIDSARQNDIEVIYVQHDGGPNDELEKNTSGWEI